MPNQIQQIIGFCSRRYNETRDARPGLARAHLAIINQANDLRLSSADPERDVLAYAGSGN